VNGGERIDGSAIHKKQGVYGAGAAVRYLYQPRFSRAVQSKESVKNAPKRGLKTGAGEKAVAVF
jgi:hypothetical protein